MPTPRSGLRAPTGATLTSVTVLNKQSTFLSLEKLDSSKILPSSTARKLNTKNMDLAANGLATGQQAPAFERHPPQSFAPTATPVVTP